MLEESRTRTLEEEGRGELEIEFPSHYSVLLSGPPGIGKFEYCLFLLRNWINSGEKVVYVTTERSPYDINVRTNECGFDITRYENLEFVDFYSAAKGSKMSKYRFFTHAKDIQVGIEDALDKLGNPVRIIFDSLSPLFLYVNSDLMMNLVEGLTSATEKKYGFIIYTMQEGVHDPQLFNTILYFVNGYLQMKFEEAEGLKRMIRTHHMKGRVYDSSWINFKIGECGFEL